MPDRKVNITKGALVMVTGVTGFVGGRIAKALLERGYRVRGTVRDIENTALLVNDVLKEYADTASFELCYIPDIAADHVYDEAILGVSAIAHVAGIPTMDPDPTKVIPATVADAISILNAAINEPSVKSFVYASSLGATTTLTPGNDVYVMKDAYNDFATKAPLAPSPYEPGWDMLTYMMSKIAAEKTMWEFAEQRRPHFTISSVVPSVIIGEALNKAHNEGDGAWIRTLYDGNTTLWNPILLLSLVLF